MQLLNVYVKFFARFGLPERTVNDNAPNFVSTEFEHFLKQNGIRHTTSAPYHPANNGLAERTAITFKDGMRKMTEGSLRQKLTHFCLVIVEHLNLQLVLLPQNY